MRSTLVALALVVTSLSASPCDAANAVPARRPVVTLSSTSYGCWHPVDTLTAYRLTSADDEASKVLWHEFALSAIRNRSCRTFVHPDIQVVHPDAGDGLTCVTDHHSAFNPGEDKPCYWIPSRGITTTMN